MPRSTASDPRGRCCGAGATGRGRSLRRKRRLVSASAAGLCSAMKPRTAIVGEIGVVERVEMRVVDRPRGRGEGEEVVDRGGDLGGALVAVAHDAGDPARVGRAAADDASQFLAQAADARRLRAANGRCARPPARGPRAAGRRGRARPRTGSSRRCRGGRARGCPGCAARRRSRRAALRASPARRGPRSRRHRHSRSSRDRPRRDRPRRPRSARRSGSAARPRRRRASTRRPGSRPAARPLPDATPSVFERCRSAATATASGLTAAGSSSAATARAAESTRSISPGKASRKKPDTRNVTSTRGRSSTEAGRISNPVTRPLDRSQTGRTPISASAWAMSSPPVRMFAVPQAESAIARRVDAVFLGVTLEQQRRRFPAELPGGLGRHGAGVDRIEIAAGRQYLGPAAARRAGGPGRHETPVEPGEKPCEFGRAASRDRRAAAAVRSSRERRGSAASSDRDAASPATRRKRQRLQTLDRVARVAPRPRAGERRGTRSGPGLGRGSQAERILAETEIVSQRAQQRGVLRARCRGPGGQRRPAASCSRSPSGLRPKT